MVTKFFCRNPPNSQARVPDVDRLQPVRMLFRVEIKLGFAIAGDNVADITRFQYLASYIRYGYKNPYLIGHRLVITMVTGSEH